MMRMRIYYSAVLVVMAIVPVSGCHTARMALSNVLKASLEMSCSGRGGIHVEF